MYRKLREMKMELGYKTVCFNGNEDVDVELKNGTILLERIAVVVDVGTFGALPGRCCTCLFFVACILQWSSTLEHRENRSVIRTQQQKRSDCLDTNTRGDKTFKRYDLESKDTYEVFVLGPAGVRFVRRFPPEHWWPQGQKTCYFFLLPDTIVGYTIHHLLVPFPFESLHIVSVIAWLLKKFPSTNQKNEHGWTHHWNWFGHHVLVCCLLGREGLFLCLPIAFSTAICSQHTQKHSQKRFASPLLH